MPLPINSVAQAFTEQQQRQADIGATQAGTLQRLMEVARIGAQTQVLQDQQRANDVMRNWMMQQASASPPNANDPNAKSVAETQAQYESPVDKSVRDFTEQARFYGQAMKVAGAAGSDAYMRHFQQLAENANNNLRQARQEQLTEQRKVMDDLAGMAYHAKSPEDVLDVVRYAYQKQGPQAAQAIIGTPGAPGGYLRSDPTDPSRFLFGDPEKAVMERIYARATDASKQASIENMQIQRWQEGAKMAQQAQQHIADMAQRERDFALRQAGINEDRALRVQNQQLDNERQSMNSAERISEGYKSDVEVRRFAEAAAAYKAAQKYLFTDKVDDKGNPIPKPKSELDAAGDLVLGTAFLKVARPDYAGTVYELKQMDHLTGVPQRIFQGLKNLAVGKELPRDVQFEMFDSMRRAMKEKNDQQIAREDSSYAKLNNLNQLPEWVNPNDYIPRYSLRPQGWEPPKRAGAPAGMMQPRSSGNPTMPAASSASTYKEGTIAKNPQTGEQIVLRNGQWQPLAQ